MIEDMNNIYNSLFGSSYAFLYKELDELKALNKILNKSMNDID